MCLAQLHIGGLVAIGVDPTGRYLLTVSHSGRGVYDTQIWQRVARDIELAYPVDGEAAGIGPLAGQRLPVVEINYDTSMLPSADLNRQFSASYEEGVLTINSTGT